MRPHELVKQASALKRGSVAEETLWVQPARLPALGDREVHVWRVSISASDTRPPIRRSVFSEGERLGAGEYMFARGRHRYATIRHILRLLLSNYLALPPSAITLARGPYGKPEMAVDRHVSSLRFNVTHSRDIGLIAISRDHEVGIDVEAVRADFDWQPIARRFFTVREYASLMSLPVSERAHMFTTVWSRKEACLKAAGLGLARGLEEIEVTSDLGHGARLIAAPDQMLPTSRWEIIDLEPGDGYRGCLVAESRGVILKQWVWPDTNLIAPQAVAPMSVWQDSRSSHGDHELR